MFGRLFGDCGVMEADEQKKLNDDLVVFMRKRSETEAPRYTARLKTYVDFQQKRRRAEAARRHTEYAHAHDKNAPAKKKAANDGELQRERSTDNKRGGDKPIRRHRSQSHSDEPVDACGRRRRRSCRRRRRRRSCRRRRRRSCSRRRRRRSCRRRRRRRRRCH